MLLEALLPGVQRVSAPSSPWLRLWRAQETRLLLALLSGGLILDFQSEAFLTVRNLRSVLLGFSFVATETLGQLLVILTGRIDLSAGSVMSMLIALVNNALVLLTVPTYWQQAFVGVLIIAAALIDRIPR